MRLAPLFLVLAACPVRTSNPPSPDPPREPVTPPAPSIWEPTTTPYDPAAICARVDCPVLRTIEDPHGEAFEIIDVPGVDDAVAQWVRCTDAIMACYDAGEGSLSDCVDRSTCPERCRTDYAAMVPPGATLQVELDVFLAVFRDEGSACVPDPIPAPPASEEVTP